MENGWEDSADAWIADMGDIGDFSRRHVLDAPMMARVALAVEAGATEALDIGCGEGRFSRMMTAAGLRVIGIDPTQAMLAAARTRDPQGSYVAARAEALPFGDAAFDLVVSYLSLTDIADHVAAFAEMRRVLRPGGRLLFANLSGYATALPDDELESGWLRAGGMAARSIARYHEPRSYWVAWRGIRVRNWHRPMESYMTPLLRAGMELSHFAEPATIVADAPDHPNGDLPLFVLMEWRKPAA